jgi:hypothetical protein
MSSALRQDILRLTGIVLARTILLSVSAVAQELDAAPIFKLEDVMTPA